MNSYIEVNDADYKYILAKGGRVEQFSGIFNNLQKFFCVDIYTIQ